MRVEQDEALWISASMIVPIAKAFITKNQFIFYEKFQRTYIDIPLNYGNTELLPPVPLELIQNILFGKPIIDVDKIKWKIIQNPTQYVLTPLKNQESVQPTLFFNPINFILEEQRIYLSSTNTLIVAEYNNFKSFNLGNLESLADKIGFSIGQSIFKLGSLQIIPVSQSES